MSVKQRMPRNVRGQLRRQKRRQLTHEYSGVVFVSDDNGATFTYRGGAERELGVALRLFEPLTRQEITTYVDNWNHSCCRRAV